jgi:hypothetical protein
VGGEIVTTALTVLAVVVGLKLVRYLAETVWEWL